jgi:hypothetical protein
VRKVAVWLPPQYDEGPRRRFPVLSTISSASARAARLSHPVQRRIGRGDRRALEELAPPRPDQPGLEVRGQPEVIARHHIDCGWRDQYHIHYGSRILSQRLAEAGIRHRYEEFDDDHSDIDYRMDVSLPFLYRALTRK